MPNTDTIDTTVRQIQVARGTPLHAGHVVYRVVEIDPAPMLAGPHIWQAAARIVERASAKQIKLKTPFPGMMRVLYNPDAFGRVFFETPLQAIKHFLAERRLEIESLDRKRKEVTRALAWAEGQEGIASSRECRACDGDGFLAIDATGARCAACLYCGGTGKVMVAKP